VTIFSAFVIFYPARRSDKSIHDFRTISEATPTPNQAMHQTAPGSDA